MISNLKFVLPSACPQPRADGAGARPKSPSRAPASLSFSLSPASLAGGVQWATNTLSSAGPGATALCDSTGPVSFSALEIGEAFTLPAQYGMLAGRLFFKTGPRSYGIGRDEALWSEGDLPAGVLRIEEGTRR